MKTPLTLLTIITESLFRERIIELVRQCGSTGYTLTKVTGEGSRGTRASDWEGPNVKIECIVSAATADAILEAVAETYFENHAVIAWTSEVNVLRGAKFVDPPGGD